MRINPWVFPTAALAISAFVAAGCGGKGKGGDPDGDDGDASDVPDTQQELDAPGDNDAPPDVPGEDVEEEEAPPTGPEHMLEYLGRYEKQSDGPDHLMGTAILASGPLLAASSTGLAVIDRTAIESGTVAAPLEKYLIDTSEASNLDGAPTGSTYFPKFFTMATSGDHAYVNARFDGMWIFQVTGSGTSWTVTEIGRHMRAREFTEGLHIVGDDLFVAHHADGVEVMDIGADPDVPATVATLANPLVDAWGVFATPEGKVWVADGAGGLKLLMYTGGTLSHLTGDVVTTSPGTLYDVTVVGDWVVAAAGGQGIAVYEEWSAARRNVYPLPGECLDVEPMEGGLIAVACRGWVHVVEIDTLGIARVMASARLHRRPAGATPSVHIGSQVSADGDTIYVAGWDHVEAYRYTDTSTAPDIQISGQRAHFGTPPGARSFVVRNAGMGTLDVTNVECTEASISCTIAGSSSASIAPGQVAELRVVYNASAANIDTQVLVSSNDPDDPVVPVLVFAALEGTVDPLEDAPEFSGTAGSWDYSTGTWEEGPLALGDYTAAGEVVHFAIFGSWCPACLPAVAGMVGDIEQNLPTGASFFVVDQGEPPSVVQHVLEKTYIPLTVFLDTDETVGAGLYDQPRVGLPFSRSYVIDQDGFVSDVYTSYSPAAILDEIDDLLP